MNRRQKIVQQQFLNNEEAIIKRLRQVYAQSSKDIDEKIEELMKRFDPETGDLPPSVVYQLQYQQQLKAQVDTVLKELQTKQYTTVAAYLDECYTDGFVGGLYDLQGQGVPFMMPIDQQAMVHAVQLESKISQGLYTRLGEDVDMLKKKITAQVSRSISTGETFAQTAKHLANYTKIGYNNAVRIARTEGHRIQCTAAMDVMHGAKDRGADVVKQWDATLDAKTRDSHADVDGEIREVDEPFSNKLMFPGDPQGSAGEVINCRCAILQRARWALGNDFTKVDGFTGEFRDFKDQTTYNEFKKDYFSKENRDYMEYVTTLEERYGKDFNKMLARMTDHEYDRFVKLENARPSRFSGIFRTKTDDPIIQQTYFHDVSATTTKLKGAMSDADYAEYMRMVQSNPDIAPLYDHLDEIPDVAYNAKKAEYWYEQKHMWFNYPDDDYVDNGMSRYRTMAHEYGHFVDRFPRFGHVDTSLDKLTWGEIDAIGAKIPRGYVQGWAMGEKYFSNSDQFLSAMRKDFVRIVGEGSVKGYCEEKLHTTIGIQDAVDGYGLGRIWWGHGDRYYNREYNNLVYWDKHMSRTQKTPSTKLLREAYADLGLDVSNQAKVKKISRQYDTASELWANMISAETTGGAELESIKEQFPETYATFKELLKVVK